MNLQDDNNGIGSARMNMQSNFAASAGFGIGVAMGVNPFLLQQEIIRRQEIERAPAGASSSEFSFPGHDAELELLSRRENELIRLRNAQNQMMQAELASRGRVAAPSGNDNDDSFRTESIERIVSLQEQRRETEQMRGLPGRRLGEWTFDMIQQHNQALALAGLKSPGLARIQYAQNMQRRLIEQEAFANSNQQRDNEMATAAGLGPQTLSEMNRPNQYYHMLQQQQQLERLMRMQQLPDDQLRQIAPHIYGSGSFLVNGIHRFRGGANAPSNGSSPGLNPHFHPAASVAASQGASSSIMQSVKDNLRYFNDGIEVDVNGKHVSTQNPAVSMTVRSSNASAIACFEDSEAMSQFVDLVLSQVPEMSHIMAGFISKRQRAGAAGTLKQGLPCLIDMALSELTSIDENVLQSIDPKCSDLASRVVQCISDIEAFKKNIGKAPSSHFSIRMSQNKQNTKEASESKTDMTKKKKKEGENVDRQDDDLSLMQVYNRSKTSAKNAKKSVKTNIKPARKRSAESDAGNSRDVIVQESNLISPPESDACGFLRDDASKPPKKQKLDKLDGSYPTCHLAGKNARVQSSEEPPKSIKGPHGDLLGVLFSSQEPLSRVAETVKTRESTCNYVKSSPVKEDCSEVSGSSSIGDDADDSDLSAASVLLDLAK